MWRGGGLNLCVVCVCVVCVGGVGCMGLNLCVLCAFVWSACVCVCVVCVGVYSQGFRERYNGPPSECVGLGV